jgi:type I restriction-modification system DNA methylase subunit
MAPVDDCRASRLRVDCFRRGFVASAARWIPCPRFPSTTRIAMFEQAFRNIDDVLWKEAGCTTELDYTEQTSWMLFLKYLDGLEQDRADVAALEGQRYAYILDKPYRWEVWAAPRDAQGRLDHNRAMSGDDLRDFVNQKLFPYLQGFKLKASGPNTIEYKIGEIFGEIKNKIHSGHNLREIIDHIDELRFRFQKEKHELSHLYEAKIQRMGNPPFGSKERKEVQQNFPIRIGKTAYLFLQHFIRILKAGGRAGVVIKNTFPSNTVNASGLDPARKCQAGFGGWYEQTWE